LYASRKASSTASAYGFEPPLIEKLMTSTLSVIAFWTAATESLWKQPWSPHTLYAMTCERGAMPLTMPRTRPKMLAATVRLPAEVLALCEPWPLSSRAVVNSVGRRPTTAS
jgi:hypothetical protein